jgi:hypothetical protein
MAHPTKTTRTSVSDYSKTHHELGAKDSKGRVIGANIYTETQVYTDTDTPAGTWPDGSPIEYNKPGAWHVWRCHATRDGQNYGATQSEHHCETLAERDAAIAKYLQDATKRASKLAVKAR